MAYNVTATFSTEQAKLEGTYPVDMVILNGSISGWEPLYFANLNQDIYGFEMDSSGELVNSDQVYTGLPLSIGDFSTTAEGKATELSISIPNTDRSVEAIIQTQQYLRSREVHVISTFAKFLPTSSNDYRYIGETPDRYATVKEKLYISSVTSNEEVITFICKPKFDLRNIQLPGRTFSKECNWDYLGSTCDPDKNISASTYPSCNYTLENCEERENSKRFGGFPSIPNRSLVIL